jgi:hypothetical protein
MPDCGPRFRVSWIATDDGAPMICRTIASSEQEAASTLGLTLEFDSRCLLSLTQAFGGEPRLAWQAEWLFVSHLLRLGTRTVVTQVTVYGLCRRVHLGTCTPPHSALGY